MTKFTKAFWVANSVELLERLAYYAVFIVITVYLSNVWNFSDIEAGVISGAFSATLYLLPTFAGAFADKIGFRSAIILAFGLLTLGYGGLGLLPTLLESAGLVTYEMTTTFSGLENSYLRWTIVPVLVLIVINEPPITIKTRTGTMVQNPCKRICCILYDGKYWCFYRQNCR